MNASSLVDSSSRWQQALEAYHKDMPVENKFHVRLESGNIEELFMSHCSPLSPGPQAESLRDLQDHLSRLKPAFKLLDNYASVLAAFFGTSTSSSALVWGSIWLMLTVCS